MPAQAPERGGPFGHKKIQFSYISPDREIYEENLKMIKKTSNELSNFRTRI